MSAINVAATSSDSAEPAHVVNIGPRQTNRINKLLDELAARGDAAAQKGILVRLNDRYNHSVIVRASRGPQPAAVASAAGVAAPASPVVTVPSPRGTATDTAVAPPSTAVAAAKVGGQTRTSPQAEARAETVEPAVVDGAAGAAFLALLLKLARNRASEGPTLATHGFELARILEASGCHKIVGSYYSTPARGDKRTGSVHVKEGERRYNPDLLTIAHPTLPMGSYVLLVNPDNGRSVVARVNDRGPFGLVTAAGKFIPPRGIDGSEEIARELRFVEECLKDLFIVHLPTNLGAEIYYSQAGRTDTEVSTRIFLEAQTSLTTKAKGSSRHKKAAATSCSLGGTTRAERPITDSSFLPPGATPVLPKTLG